MFKAGSRVPSCRWTLPWYHYGFPRARKSDSLANVAGLFFAFPLTCLPIKDGRGFSPGHLCLASPFVFLRFCLCSTFLVSRVCVHSSQGLGVEFFTLMVSRGCKQKTPLRYRISVLRFGAPRYAPPCVPNIPNIPNSIPFRTF